MNVLIMPLYGIGDVLMSTPAVRNLKERLGARITYLHMFRSTAEMLKNNPYVDENLHFPFLEAGRLEGVRFLLGMRGRFDASISFYPSNRRDYNLAAFLAGASVRLGHRYGTKDIMELNFLKNRTVMERDDLHNVEEDLRLLSFLGISGPEPYPMQIFFTEEEECRAKDWLAGRGLAGKRLAGFHPGCSLFKEHAKRRWPAEKFSELIGRLASRYPDMEFLVFGGPEEAELKETVRAGSAVPERAHTVSTGIRGTAALIKRCGVFVANDSGLMHMSAAVQTPTVGIFGPTNPAWVRPWKCRSAVVRLPEGCPPCFRYSPVPLGCPEKKEFQCLRDIEADEVFRAAECLLQDGNPGLAC